MEPSSHSVPARARKPAFDRALNPQQLAVVTSPDGPLLVLAGAGSGKTRALTCRVAYLLDRGVAPEEVLLLTFTNKAAREMLERVRALTGVEPGRLWGGTFHRVANRILGRHAGELGYGPHHTILDREDATALLREALEEEPGREELPRAEVLAAAISYACNTRRPLAEVLLERWPTFLHRAESVEAIERRYASRKLGHNAMDFDDLLVNLLRLVQERPARARELRCRFRHLLVDEYQDTNRLQAELVDVLGREHGNILVVGDDAQCIYSFRGAEHANILEFPRRYPGTRVLRLESNYRSTPEILELANAVLSVNRNQLGKTLRPVRGPGPRPALVVMADGAEQARFVASRVRDLRGTGLPLAAMAVLYRAHHHAVELELELKRRRIPYEVRSGTRFFEMSHVKDLLAHLRVLENPRDELAWRRLLVMLPRVGKKTADRFLGALRGRPGPREALRRGELDHTLPRASRERWQALREHLEELAEVEEPGAAIQMVLGGPYQRTLHDSHADAASRLEDLASLVPLARSFATRSEFLSELALDSDAEPGSAGGPAEAGEPPLVLSTVHQAKGLEWRAVFLLWLVEGRFPASRGVREEAGEEEERRLFYVAVTRAEDQLYLCCPRFGRDEYRERVLLRPSRFLEELPDRTAEPWEVYEASRTRGFGEDPGPPDSVFFDDGPFRDP